MSKKQKLIDRLKNRPRDFTFAEAETLLLGLGFKRMDAGKTGGSRVAYKLGHIKIKFHKPHPQKELKPYQLLQLLADLEKEGLV